MQQGQIMWGMAREKEAKGEEADEATEDWDSRVEWMV